MTISLIPSPLREIDYSCPSKGEDKGVG